MRGKKTDPEFVSLFITDCVKEGKETPEAICAHARKMITEIDEAIKEIEEDKKFRSKLLDVIASFEETKRDKSGDAKLLPFFELKYPEACHHLCNVLKKSSVISTNFSGEVPPDVRFSIKQLIEARIICRFDDQLSQGERFEEYLAFIGLE